MKTQLKLYFVTFTNNPYFKNFEILDQTKSINFGSFETIKIPEDFFGEEYSKMIQIKLVNEETENIIKLKLNKNDDNYCCTFCDNIGKTYHLLFNQEKDKEEKIDISIPSYEFHFDKYDINGTKYRKRLILANIHFPLIKINDACINFSELTEGLDQNATSYQLSVYNYKKNQIVTKALDMPKHTICFEQIYNDNYQVFDKFIQDFNKALDDEKDFNENFNQLFEKYKGVGFPDYFLNISKKKIEKELNKAEYLDFFYNMMVFRIYNEHIKGSKKSFHTVKSFVAYLKEKTDKIKKDTDLKLYQKILLIEQIGHILNKMTKDSFLKSDINYFIMSKKEENSILDFVEKFFQGYINNLSEDSKIFFKLLELDSGIGYYKGNIFHCFDMTTIDEIKAHLKEIFIDTLITYKANERVCAFIITKTGAVAINLSEIPGYEAFFLEKKLEKYEITQGKDVAAKIVEFLLHEIYGHKKFLYEKEKYIISPYYFFQDDEYYFLEYKNSASKDPNAIKILPKNTYSDDGTYYELSYGKIGDYYAIEIIDEMNGYGDLLDEINLWTDDLDSLNEYFKFKYIIQCKKIPLNNCPLNIKEKIQFFKEQVLKSGVDVESFYKKDTKPENEYLGKKKKRPNNIYSKGDKDFYNKPGIGRSENEDKNEDNDASKEKNTIFNFDAMSYDELANLYYNGKLKGDSLSECYKRISEYEIQSKIIQ